MRRRSLSLALGAALMLGTALPATAQQGTSINYEEADLRAVADDIATRTGRTFVIDPTLAGSVTIISPPDANLDPETVWRVFQATLRLNGFTAVPIGDREYTIVRSQQALREAGNEVGGIGPNAVTRVVPLRFISAADAANAVRGVVADTGLVVPLPESNTLIVADSGDNVERVVGLLAELDVDDSVVRSVALQNAPASEVAGTLREIADAQGAEGRRGTLSIVPVPATNRVVLRGSPQEVQRLLPIVRELDTSTGGQAGLDTIYLNHADAEEMVTLLQSVLGEQLEGAQEGPPVQRSSGPRTSIGFDAGTNAIVVNAPPDTQRLVRQVVARLDIRRPQVLIEAIVVELSDSTARELGVQYLSGGDNVPITAASFSGTNNAPPLLAAAGAAYFLGPGSDSITGGSVTVTDGGTVIRDNSTVNPALQTVAGQLVEAAVGQLLGYNGFLAGFADVQDDGSVYGVLLNAIQSDATSNILDTPHVTVLDNEAARLQIGQNVPITTGRASGDDFRGGVFTNVEREDIGTILEVTPTINDGNTVQLEISLELSSIGAFAGPNQDIILNKRQVNTKAVAEDGQTLVLGGLIGTSLSNSESKVPLLGDIPVLGNLFKGQNRQRTERTLMVFIRPTIIRDELDAAAVTARKYDYAEQRQRRADRLRRNEPSRLQMLEEEVLGTGSYGTMTGGAFGAGRPPEGDADIEPIVGQPAPDTPAEGGLRE